MKRRVSSLPTGKVTSKVTPSSRTVNGGANATTYSRMGEPVTKKPELDKGMEGDPWIPQHINGRCCKRFFPLDGSQSPDSVCGCGRQRKAHSDDARNVPHSTHAWNEDRDTETFPTNAFGELEFVGFGQKVAKYARVDDGTSIDTMLKLMMSQWQLESPNLLISVTGGAKNFSLRPRLKDVFRRGMMKLALSTGAWITSAGTHAGVMKHIGEAVRDYGIAAKKTVIAIGIAPWGCVQGKDDLIDDTLTGKWPAQYRLDSSVSMETPLDPNHTHFILVDNGTKHKFGTEIAFRANLENAICSHAKPPSGGVDKSAAKVPIVLVVLEGGPGTLQTVYSSILNGTPAVIVEGSGRIADLLAYAYQNAQEEQIVVIDQEGQQSTKTIMGMTAHVEATVTEMITGMFGSRELSRTVGWLKECLQNPDLLTVYQIDSKASANDLDIAILKALLKANKDQILDQLRFALAWNRVDVARSEIFTDDREWKAGSLDDIMMSAILLDRVDFVQLFLENGVCLRDFLTEERLLQLYSQIPIKSQLYIMLSRIKNKSRLSFNLRDVGVLIRDLIGDFYEPLYLRLTKKSQPSNDDALIMSDISDKCYFKQPQRELFIWCILMDRGEMARFFWEDGKEPIASSLVANALLSGFARKTDDTNLAHNLQQHALQYEEIAIGVLNECYAVDELSAQMLLVRELHYWGNTTCVLIAVQADSKRFIAQSACQALLNTIWHGKLNRDNTAIMLIVSTCFPLILFTLNYIPANKYHLTEQLDSPHKEVKTLPKQTTQSSLQTITSIRSEEPNAPSSISPWYKVRSFFTSPVIRFSYSVVGYILFLLLFSYCLMIRLEPDISIPEIILIIWVFTIFVEEIRQFITNSSSTMKNKFSSYMKDNWNKADLITLTLFTTGTILRFIPDPDALTAARVILALSLITFYLRLLHIFSVHKQLGPKLVMIERMVVDLLYFVVILLVFIVAYGVASEAILYPQTRLEPQIIVSVLRKAYWQIFGELFLDELEGSQTCTNDYLIYNAGDIPRCASSISKWVVPILMGLYMLFTNVLLLNLLIAMFSYTFTAIQENTDLHWYFQRYSLIYEYYERPLFPPPLVILSHFSMLCEGLVRHCRGVAKSRRSHGFKQTFSLLEMKRLNLWEEMTRDDFVRKTEDDEVQTIHNQVTAATEKLDVLVTHIDALHEHQLSLSPAGQADVAATIKIPQSLENRLNRLDDQMGVTFSALDWIIKAMTENNMAAKSLPPPKIPDLMKQKQKGQQDRADQLQKERDLVKDLNKRRNELHFKSRTSPYPESQVHRYPVPDDKVLWQIRYPEYSPFEYTSETVMKNPPWADTVDLLSLDAKSRPALAWNTYDNRCKIDRKSKLGPYDIREGLPLNPRGRTGIAGRGLLGRWGPNHAGNPVVTRWKRDPTRKIIERNGKPVLEFIAIIRMDNKQWSLPGGIVMPGENVCNVLRTEFTEEALGKLMDDEDKRKVIKGKLDKLFTLGVEVYSGYADDPRNTDNAWLETRAVNFHNDDGAVLEPFSIQAGETEEAVSWLTASSTLTLHGSHLYIIQQVTNTLGAAF